MKKCVCCGKEMENVVKIKMGHICTDCLERLPRTARENPEWFNKKQIKRLMEAFSDTQRPSEDEIAIGDVRWRFCVCRNYIYVNYRRLYFKDIDTIRLVYHPLQDAGNGEVRARACIALRIKKMSGEFEESINDCFTTRYTIKGNSITYEGFPTLSRVIDEVSKAMRTGGDLSDYINAMRARREREREERARREREERARREREERARREREERARREREQQSRRRTRWWNSENTRANTEGGDSKLEAAKRLFSVKEPFTMTQLKKERNRLLKIYHPDEAGGSNQKCREIYDSFDLLKRYAS